MSVSAYNPMLLEWMRMKEANELVCRDILDGWIKSGAVATRKSGPSKQAVRWVHIGDLNYMVRHSLDIPLGSKKFEG